MATKKLSEYVGKIKQITRVDTTAQVENLNASLLMGHTVGPRNNDIPLNVAFPDYKYFNSMGYYSGSPEIDYFEALLKWAIDNYSQMGIISLSGVCCPNSYGICCFTLYSNFSKDETTGLPAYASGIYIGDHIRLFHVSNYIFHTNTVLTQ